MSNLNSNISQDYIFTKLAQRLSPAQKPVEELTPAWRWKLRFDECVDWEGKIVDKDKFQRVKEDLYRALMDAPGEARYVPGPQQWAAHKSATETKTVQVAGGWRAGKLLEPKTPLLTSKGWKTHGEVEVGDEVYRPDGTLTKVIRLSPEWRDRDFYEVKFSDGTSIVADGAHEWETHDYDCRKAANREGKKRTANYDPAVVKNPQNIRRHYPKVRETREIADSLMKRVSSIRDRWDYNHSIPFHSPLRMPDRELLLDPYILGAWLGDGSSNGNIITGIDSEIFGEIRRVGFEVTDLDYKHHRVHDLQKVLRQVGVLNNKHIPQEYLLASESQRLALLQGLMDTDGTVSVSGKVEFNNTNKSLSEGVAFLARSLGMKATMTSRIPSCNGKPGKRDWRVRFPGKLPVFRLSRKLDRLAAKCYDKENDHRYIVSITFVGKGSGRCFEVEHSDGLYLAGSQLVTTHQSKWLAAELLPYTFIDNSVIWNVANTFTLAQEEFKYVHQWLVWLGAPVKVATPASGAWVIKNTEWNAVFQTKTADDIKSLEAANCNVVGIAEAGLVQEEVLQKLQGRVLQKRGHVLISGSFEMALPWYFEMFKQNINGGRLWKSYSIPSWENLIVFPDGREDQGIKDQEELSNLLDPSGNYFRMKICAEPVKPMELVFPMFDTKLHVVNIEWDDGKDPNLIVDVPMPVKNDLDGHIEGWLLPRNRPVEVAVDPGYYPGSYAVLAIQKFDHLVFVIDEIYVQNTVTEDVIEMAKGRWWWRHVIGGVIDKAAMQHNAQKSHWEIWREPKHGNLHLRQRYVPVADGTQRLRTMLIDPQTKRPFVYFRAGHSKSIAHEFDLYRYRPESSNRAQRDEPLDRDNHAIKALTYWLVDAFGFVTDPSRRVKAVKYINQGASQGRHTGDPFYEGPNVEGTTYR